MHVNVQVHIQVQRRQRQREVYLHPGVGADQHIVVERLKIDDGVERQLDESAQAVLLDAYLQGTAHHHALRGDGEVHAALDVGRAEVKGDAQARDVARVVVGHVEIGMVAADADDKIPFVFAGQPGRHRKAAGDLHLRNEQVGAFGELAADEQIAAFGHEARGPYQLDESRWKEDAADADQVDFERAAELNRRHDQGVYQAERLEFDAHHDEVEIGRRREVLVHRLGHLLDVNGRRRRHRHGDQRIGEDVLGQRRDEVAVNAKAQHHPLEEQRRMQWNRVAQRYEEEERRVPLVHGVGAHAGQVERREGDLDDAAELVVRNQRAVGAGLLAVHPQDGAHDGERALVDLNPEAVERKGDLGEFGRIVEHALRDGHLHPHQLELEGCQRQAAGDLEADAAVLEDQSDLLDAHRANHLVNLALRTLVRLTLWGRGRCGSGGLRCVGLVVVRGCGQLPLLLVAAELQEEREADTLGDLEGSAERDPLADADGRVGLLRRGNRSRRRIDQAQQVVDLADLRVLPVAAGGQQLPVLEVHVFQHRADQGQPVQTNVDIKRKAEQVLALDCCGCRLLGCCAARTRELGLRADFGELSRTAAVHGEQQSQQVDVYVDRHVAGQAGGDGANEIAGVELERRLQAAQDQGVRFPMPVGGFREGHSKLKAVQGERAGQFEFVRAARFPVMGVDFQLDCALCQRKVQAQGERVVLLAGCAAHHVEGQPQVGQGGVGDEIGQMIRVACAEEARQVVHDLVERDRMGGAAGKSSAGGAPLFHQRSAQADDQRVLGKTNLEVRIGEDSVVGGGASAPAIADLRLEAIHPEFVVQVQHVIN